MQKNRKKSKKRRLLLAILMLMLTGLMTVTSTYAWFTANKTVTVNSINVNVAASSGLQISVDGVEWKPAITNEDIIATITGDNENYPENTNQFPSGDLGNLAPVSTTGVVDATGLMEMYLGSIGADAEGNYSLTAVKDTEKKGQTGNFIAFDLFLQVQTESTIYLTNMAKVTAGQNKNTGIQNATRVGFIVSDSTPAGDPSATIQALKGKTSKIWEPNNDVHTAAGIANATNVYKKADVKTTESDPLTYYGVHAPITEGVELNSQDATYFTVVDPALKTGADGIDAGEYLEAFTLQAGISKVRVYLWVEGQDVDCESVASGGSLTFDLQFSLDANNG